MWESDLLTAFIDEMTIPAAAVRPGRTYRVRGAHADDTGKWSHWSAPIEFVAATPDVSAWKQDLMITEIMYHLPTVSADEALEIAGQRRF